MHALRIALRSLQLLKAGGLGAFVWLRELVRRDTTLGGRDRLLRAAGRALVAFCADLGATFIKIGQIASTRADLLPGPLVAELRSLQDRVPPFSFARARQTLERELGQPLEALFASFEPEPVAAASVAQVHRAIWRASGRLVAVKIRRPDIVEKVELDRSILLFVGRNLERFVPTLHLISLEEALRNFCQAVEQQLDLAREAEHNLRFRQNFADDPDIRFPALVPGACSDAVLTMEYVEGIHEDRLEAEGVDVQRIVKAGMRAVCRMVFLHGFVHADLHPGNLRFLPSGRVVFLDLGLVGEIDDADRITTAQLLFALATGDGRTVARLFYENAPHQATPDYPRYEAEMAAFVASVRHKGLDKLQVTLEIGRIFDILRRHRIQARAHMTMVNLALMTAEGLGKRLAPELNLTSEALPYLAEALGRPMPATPPRTPRPTQASAGGA